MNQRMLYRSMARQLLRQKFKSLLMMLGVTIGVFTLTAGLALGEGAKRVVLDYFSRIFLPDSLTIVTVNDGGSPRGLRESDVQAIVNDVAGITAWSPMMSGGRQDLVRGGNRQTAAMLGVSASGALVTGQGVEAGEYFSEQDVNGRARVVLLGRTVREALFGEESPLGQQLTIGSQVFEVKGVLTALGGDPHGGDLDNVILIPYTTLLQADKSEDLRNVRLRLQDAAAVQQATRHIPLLLRERHQITAGQQDDFHLMTAPAGQAAFEQFEEVFRIVLPIVVAVILLISTLVIASMMLIAVKERGAEIGLRKAVGARAADVEHQFTIETLLLAGCGGISGIALALPLLAYVQDFYRAFNESASFMPAPWMYAVSLLSAVLTGVLAAWLPARRAASLNPLATLR